jgi:5-methylcytosine-specific restriction endonuclease McrA
MADVIKFARAAKAVTRLDVAPAAESRAADCPVCSGGLGGVCGPCLAVAPMRMVVQRACGECGHAWSQPSLTGDCPKCHSAQTVNVGAYTNGLRRL